MELLLTLETQARMDALEEESKRQRTLRFEIPPHPRSTELVHKRRWSAPDDWISALSATALKNHLSKWMHFQRRSSSEDHEDESSTIQVGSRVKLYKRPMPIIGVVKYKGPVCFDQGEWLGIELDSRGIRKKKFMQFIKFFFFQLETRTDLYKEIIIFRPVLIVVYLLKWKMLYLFNKCIILYDY